MACPRPGVRSQRLQVQKQWELPLVDVLTDTCQPRVCAENIVLIDVSHECALRGTGATGHEGRRNTFFYVFRCSQKVLAALSRGGASPSRAQSV